MLDAIIGEAPNSLHHLVFPPYGLFGSLALIFIAEHSLFFVFNVRFAEQGYLMKNELNLCLS